MVSDPKFTPRGRRWVKAYLSGRATGPYEVVEQPNHVRGEPSALAQIRTWARTCHRHIVCPIKRVVDVHGTHVLLIGNPQLAGGLHVFWLRHDRPHSILTWIGGPTDYAHGDLPHHYFKPSAALSAAAKIIARGG
jgi:hypothetical protein